MVITPRYQRGDLGSIPDNRSNNYGQQQRK
jgi:hypothetical protein